MSSCKIVVLSLMVVLLTVGIRETQGQEGLPSPSRSYYQPRVASNYPMLAGNRIIAGNEITLEAETVSADTISIGVGCGCGIHLLPALAQGLRTTLDRILPYRGTHRGQGLFFSHRFYSSNCCGCEEVTPGIIYESDPSQIPTPAKSIEEIPSKVAPTTSLILPPRSDRNYSTVSVGNIGLRGTVRPVQYNVPLLTTGSRVPSIPHNPLRR